MKTALKPPLAPMEAKAVDEIPTGDEWQYEPKWDGFRCLVFRDGDNVFLQSKSGQPLARYFPEIVEAIRELKARRFVLDGELLVPIGQRSSFDDLLQRIHPAASRVQKLARERPAILIVFDLLDDDGKSLIDATLAERRPRLERFAAKNFVKDGRLRLSPATTSLATARRWFRRVGAALDGVIAKRLDVPYLSGDRSGMQKVKPIRTAECVVGGFRYASKGGKVGSLLLGLFNDDGKLDHVGFTASFTAKERQQVEQAIREHIGPPGFTGSAPGGPSRWSTKRSTEWTPLDDKLVVEVEYDQFTSGRFRHGTKLLRWRPDKAPRQCKFDQLEQGGGSLRLLNGRA
ncbi:MAG TPA: ATP-dependent DNA ligase [Pirellulales bacterium]|nr:ATP-dependent DNA ligase [Pirellulales bacterium]